MDRIIKISRILIDSSSPVTVGSIAERLDVSGRTVRNDMDSVQEYLNRFDIELIRKPGCGVEISGSEKNKALARNAIINDSKYFQPFSQEDRLRYILVKLFMNKPGVTVKSLSDKLYVSRMTIHKDLLNAQDWLDKYNIKLLRKPDSYMEISGDENDIRKAIADLIAKSKEYNVLKGILNRDYHTKIDCQSLKQLKDFIDIDYGQLEIIVQKAEEKLKFNFSEEAYLSLIIHIAICIKRINDGKDITLSKDVIESLKSKNEYIIAKDMANDIKDKFKVELPESEVGYILLHILGSKMMNDRKLNVDINVEDIKENNLACIVAKEIINIAEKALDINLKKDKQLFNGLVLHLRPTINRLKYGLTLRNPLLNEIKENYPDIYGVSWMTNIIFEKYIGVKMPEEEIAYIAMHIGAAVERNKKPLKTLVVCTSGIGTSQLLAAKLTKSFRQIKVEDVVSSLALKDMDIDFYDLIISTVPVECSKPVLLISPLLSISDIEKIEKYIIYLENNKQCKIIAVESPGAKQKIGDRNGVLNFIYNDLYKKKYVKRGYFDSLMKRELNNSTIIGNNIALPHGLPEYVNKSCLSILTLDNEIEWGTDKADIVISINIARNDMDKARNIMGKLYNFIDDEKELKKLRECENSEQIIKVLGEFINAY